MKDKLQDLILPKLAFAFNRMCEEESIFYECRDCKVFDFGKFYLIFNKPSEIFVIVPLSLLMSYMEGLQHV